MPRQVKCVSTGEVGTSDTFIKINNKYFKSQDIYSHHIRQVSLRKEIIKFVLFHFLKFRRGQPAPTYLYMKIKALSFYDNEVILRTLRQKDEDITYWLGQGEFDNDVARIAYIFTAVGNAISAVYIEWLAEQPRQSDNADGPLPFVVDDIENITTPKRQGKNISAFLESDEL